MNNKIKLKLRIISILISFVMVCLYISPLSHVNAIVEWIEYTDKEVSLDGQKYVVDACVVNDGTTYEMWYTHGKTSLELDDLGTAISSIFTENIIADIIALDFETLLTNHLSELDTDALWNYLNDSSTVIGYATSNDGLDWNVQDNEVLAVAGNGWDSLGMPCVVKTDGSYEMWYTHTKLNMTIADIDTAIANMADHDKRVDTIISVMDSFYSTIGYATSPDGQTWNVINDAVLPATGTALWDSVADPSVVKNGDGYEMWYTFSQTDLTRSDLEQIMTDVRNYDFDSDNLWNALDQISSTIVYATSADGINWITFDTSGLTLNDGIWDSVASASVVKTAEGYEMWYSHWITDLTMTTFQELVEEIEALQSEFEDTWTVLKSGDYDAIQLELIQYFGDPDDPGAATLLDNIKPYLDNTASLIGYATSDDGITWVIENPEALVGDTSSLWSSVASPCVVVNNGFYEMWFMQGLDVLNGQTVLDLIDGAILPIGYAYYVSSINIELVEGWNMIGLPLTPSPASTAVVLDSILDNVRTIWKVDAATNQWSYYTTIPGAPQGTLTDLSVGEGYWIELTADSVLAVSGELPSLPFSIDLVTGWNLIAIPQPSGSNATADILAEIIDNVQTVWTCNAIDGIWSYYTTIVGVPQGTLLEMNACHAYWIEMTADDTLVIN